MWRFSQIHFVGNQRIYLFQYIQCEGSACLVHETKEYMLDFNTSNVKVQHAYASSTEWYIDGFQYIQCEGSALASSAFDKVLNQFQYIQCEGSAIKSYLDGCVQ